MSASSTSSVVLTAAARERLAALLRQRGHGVGVRLVLNRTGCSGLAYALQYADARQPEDLAFGDPEAPLLLAASELPYVAGLRLDWVSEGTREGFTFTNPNERGRCGCGRSFRL